MHQRQWDREDGKKGRPGIQKIRINIGTVQHGISGIHIPHKIAIALNVTDEFKNIGQSNQCPEDKGNRTLKSMLSECGQNPPNLRKQMAKFWLNVMFKSNGLEEYGSTSLIVILLQ